MTKVLIFLCLFTVIRIIDCFSQTITLIDNEDLKPIAEAAVLNEENTRFIYTSRAGKADISAFDRQEKIFQIPYNSIDRISGIKLCFFGSLMERKRRKCFGTYFDNIL